MSIPSGLGRRRQRLSDAETTRRMLDTAVAMVNRTGLTVSLEHISLEDVIRDAGVSRSAVYRRWPYKDLFFSDLLRALAQQTYPGAGTDADAAEYQREFAREHADWLATAKLRRRFCVEMLRRGAVSDFESIIASAEWRTYIALHATFLSLADGELRDEVGAALADSERRFVGRLAAAYEHVTGLLGFRLRPELHASFELLASLANATLRGLVISGLSSPQLVSGTVHAAPFGEDEPSEWSPAGLGIASIVLTFVEPDPTVVWDDARIVAVRAALLEERWTPD